MDRYTPSSDAYYDSAEIEVLEHYEINRERHKDERDGIQKKTFTKWVNKHLAKVSAHLFSSVSFNCRGLFRLFDILVNSAIFEHCLLIPSIYLLFQSSLCVSPV
ncbi:hypothetical protein ANCCAN_16270 [Ancylostoma caninum]|uniref:Calponin-homology (CH) domain-containing protein n=1 Tax=Ancylostoma caninum TaxID=29170 RepID=A0A368G049_ANCCA|nr:hypothetical protein ANCCAN_16270 [Ancylostoma caninum]